MTGTGIVTSPCNPSSGNALRHGLFAQAAVLPWEDGEEFAALHAAIVAEYAPEGPIERYLVEELAAAMWRRRRLAAAERALHGRTLRRAMSEYHLAAAAVAHLGSRPDEPESVEGAFRAGPEETARELASARADEGTVRRALDLLDGDDGDRVAAAIRALPEHYRSGVTARLGRRKSADDPDTVAEVIVEAVLAPIVQRRKRLECRPLVREQALAEAAGLALDAPHARYEAHLDRKFLRTLSALHRLQGLREEGATTTS